MAEINDRNTDSAVAHADNRAGINQVDQAGVTTGTNMTETVGSIFGSLGTVVGGVAGGVMGNKVGDRMDGNGQAE